MWLPVVTTIMYIPYEMSFITLVFYQSSYKKIQEDSEHYFILGSSVMSSSLIRVILITLCYLENACNLLPPKLLSVFSSGV